MESEIRVILVDAVSEPADEQGLFHNMLDRFGEVGGVELEVPDRATPPRAAELPT
jgi:hypothetical protein